MFKRWSCYWADSSSHLKEPLYLFYASFCSVTSLKLGLSGVSSQTTQTAAGMSSFHHLVFTTGWVFWTNRCERGPTGVWGTFSPGLSLQPGQDLSEIQIHEWTRSFKMKICLFWSVDRQRRGCRVVSWFTFSPPKRTRQHDTGRSEFPGQRAFSERSPKVRKLGAQRGQRRGGRSQDLWNMSSPPWRLHQDVLFSSDINPSLRWMNLQTSAKVYRNKTSR